MKKIAILAVMAMASSAFAQKTEADFAGFYAGASIGSNHAQASEGKDMDKHASVYPGLVVGHNTAFDGMLYGVEGYADFHKKSFSGRDFGMGFKVGKVVSNVLVFTRVGITGSSPSFRPQMALGAEYKLDKNLSLTGLISHDRTTDEGVTRQNNNLTVGVNYFFR